MKIKYIKLKQYKYELSDDLVIQTNLFGYDIVHKFFTLTPSGLLTIFNGYKWDGVSGPMIDSDNSMIGGCVHDSLYQMIRLGLLPKMEKMVCDNIMRALFEACNMWKFRSGYAYYGVYLFGYSSCIVGDIHIPEVITLEYNINRI